MARYIYQWKPTEHGRRLYRTPTAAAPIKRTTVAAPEPETETVDYGAMLKTELVETADERGIDSTGTKADIIERLEADDE